MHAHTFTQTHTHTQIQDWTTRMISEVPTTSTNSGRLPWRSFMKTLTVATLLTTVATKASSSSSSSTRRRQKQIPGPESAPFFHVHHHRHHHHHHHQVALDPNPIATLEELADRATKEEIDAILDQILGTSGGIIIQRYRPERWWLWQQYYGTVLYHSFRSAMVNMMVTFGICLFMSRVTNGRWTDLTLNRNHMWVVRLALLETVWKNSLMNVTTFLLTFFVGQAYHLWRTVYDIGRSIQGRMNDIQLLLATHAKRRKQPFFLLRRRPSRYTMDSQLFLESMAEQLRAFHILLWASNARRFRMLLTEPGLSRMVARGILTPSQLETLQALPIPPTQRHVAILEWIVMSCRQARRESILQGSDGLDYILLDKICALRSVVGQLQQKLSGRMPLAYAHFVQILVDVFLCLAPWAQ